MAIGRFAPTPSGPLHLGNLRTALIAWLTARSAGSRFVLRIDDLDAAKCLPEHEWSQLADLAAIGIDWDGPIVHQSDRRADHDEAVDHLRALGLVYECYCTRREIREASVAPHGPMPEGAYPGTCRDLDAAARAERSAAGRPPALRLRAEGTERTFVDALHGEVRGVCDDFVVRRNDGTAAYNVAVVVDDDAAGIEQVVRGDDLLDSTARQVLVAELLGVPAPIYAHVPLVLGPDGGRLAKRRGDATLDERRASGQTPAQVVALLGASLGLCTSDDDVRAADLVDGFDLQALPSEPWVLTDGV